VYRFVGETSEGSDKVRSSSVAGSSAPEAPVRSAARKRPSPGSGAWGAEVRAEGAGTTGRTSQLGVKLGVRHFLAAAVWGSEASIGEQDSMYYRWEDGLP
jgi:hypothetical protein